MKQFLAFICILAVANCQTSPYPWPKPNEILGLWPLNNYYRFKDVTGKLNGPTGEGTGNGRVDSDSGPFGDPYQSMKPINGILDVRDAASVEKLQLKNSSFTISFFLKHRGVTTDGLFQFQTDGTSRPKDALSMDFIAKVGNNNNFQISTSGGETLQYQLISDSEWQFIAVTYNAETNRMSIAGRHGTIYKNIISKKIAESLQESNDGFTLGKSNSGGLLNGYSSMSCLSIYKVALTDEELYQLQDVCRLLHSSSPCGATRLPMTAIPPTTTTVARQGQFPWIASVTKDGNLACVASLLDPRHVLTTASCLGSIDSTNLKTYKVIVGNHDYKVQDSFQQTISVGQHIIHKDYDSFTKRNNIAILELSSAVDMGSAYVNDVCLPSYDVQQNFVNDTVTYVVGWGNGGRNELVSATSLRYVTGVPRTSCGSNGDESSYGFESAYDAPGTGDEGAGMLLPVGADGFQAAPRFVQRGIYNGVDSCNKPRFESIETHWPWIKEKIACYLPGGKTLSTCPKLES